MSSRHFAHRSGRCLGEAGTIAVILPGDRGLDPQLRFARIPADFPPDHIIELERVPAEQMPVAAHLIGHPLPCWTDEEITRAGAALWNPDRWAPEQGDGDGKPVAVNLAVPRTLIKAQKFRDSVTAVCGRIESGQIDAPAGMPDSLRGLVYRAWETR
ncbi:hypothetical protein ACFXHA_43395 [Nocardia sp. NPDC059240]|uniref:hypothetical protein n=1 Tax=Nocardia sp. NPDC059240 TaxID=3346786 RepID=UPI0036802E0D